MIHAKTESPWAEGKDGDATGRGEESAKATAEKMLGVPLVVMGGDVPEGDPFFPWGGYQPSPHALTITTTTTTTAITEIATDFLIYRYSGQPVVEPIRGSPDAMTLGRYVATWLAFLRSRFAAKALNLRPVAEGETNRDERAINLPSTHAAPTVLHRDLHVPGNRGPSPHSSDSRRSRRLSGGDSAARGR